MYSGQYDAPHPSDGSMWTQLHEEVRVKMPSEQMTKVGKPRKPNIRVGIVKFKR